MGEIFNALAAFTPMGALERLHTLGRTEGLNRFDFGIRVGDEVVDGHRNRHAELLHIFQVASKIGQPLLDRVHAFLLQIILSHPAMHFERAHRGNDDRRRRCHAGLAALDVEELFCPQISPEARFGDHIIRQLQRRSRRHDRVAAMRDIGKRAAMHKGGVIFERLHEIRHQRVFQKHGHRPRCLQVFRQHLPLVTLLADNDLANAALQIFNRSGQAQDRHDLRGNRDVKARFTRIAIGHTTQRADNLAQRPVVHVHDPTPSHTTRVDAQLIAPINMVVDQGRQQIMGRGDGVEIAGKVQVDVFHRHDLRITATRRPALHAKARPQGRLAQADHRLLADAVETIAQAHRRRRLAFARRRGVDGGDENQLAVLLGLQAINELQIHLGLGVPIGNKALGRNPQFCADFHNRLHLGFARDFNVTLYSHFVFLSGIIWSLNFAERRRLRKRYSVRNGPSGVALNTFLAGSVTVCLTGLFIPFKLLSCVTGQGKF